MTRPRSLFSQGGDGCLSVAATAAPGLCRAMYSAWKQGETARAQQLAAAVARLASVLARESNPAPLKYALSLMNLMSARVRLPLVEVKSETKADIEKVLMQIGTKYSGCMIGDFIAQDRKTARSCDSTRAKPKFVLVC
jgi:4-hydroxy-tetrahydrodipicolinate synthase